MEKAAVAMLPGAKSQPSCSPPARTSFLLCLPVRDDGVGGHCTETNLKRAPASLRVQKLAFTVSVRFPIYRARKTFLFP